MRRAGLGIWTAVLPAGGARAAPGREFVNAVVSMVGDLGQGWRGAPKGVIIADPAPVVDPPRHSDLPASGLVTGGVSASVIRTEAVGESHLTRRRPPKAVAVAANRRAVIGVER